MYVYVYVYIYVIYIYIYIYIYIKQWTPLLNSDSQTAELLNRSSRTHAHE